METKSIKKYVINTDGGSRGNPGKAAWAFVVKENDRLIHTEYGYLGIATNNQAEYTALLKAMEWLEKNGSAKEVDFFLDSQLVVMQITGVYKIKDENLRKLSEAIWASEKRTRMKCTYNYVPRERNKEADHLVNVCLDEE